MSATVYSLWVINKAGGLVYDKHLNRQSVQSTSLSPRTVELTRPSFPPSVSSSHHFGCLLTQPDFLPFLRTMR